LSRKAVRALEAVRICGRRLGRRRPLARPPGDQAPAVSPAGDQPRSRLPL